jgi:hypothetical protein
MGLSLALHNNYAESSPQTTVSIWDYSGGEERLMDDELPADAVGLKSLVLHINMCTPQKPTIQEGHVTAGPPPTGEGEVYLDNNKEDKGHNKALTPKTGDENFQDGSEISGKFENYMTATPLEMGDGYPEIGKTPHVMGDDTETRPTLEHQTGICHSRRQTRI